MAETLPPGATGVLALADGTVFQGIGVGAETSAVGEVCFNTAMTGYQEILTDPSYAGQIITFTFPHIGNIGTNAEDIETVNLAATPGARGIVLNTRITRPSSYRSNTQSSPGPNTLCRSSGFIGSASIGSRHSAAVLRSAVSGPSRSSA